MHHAHSIEALGMSECSEGNQHYAQRLALPRLHEDAARIHMHEAQSMGAVSVLMRAMHRLDGQHLHLHARLCNSREERCFQLSHRQSQHVAQAAGSPFCFLSTGLLRHLNTWMNCLVIKPHIQAHLHILRLSGASICFHQID